MASNRRAGSSRRFIGMFCAALALSACTPSMEDVIAEHRGPAEATFEKIKGLYDTASSTPPIVEDRFDLGTQTIVLDGEQPNALFILADDLQAPEYADTEDRGGTHAHTVRACGDALTGEASGHPGAFEGYLKECGRAEYLFVLRTHAEESAQIIDRESFQPGFYEGDVLLIRIADGALLGGFRVSGRNGDSVTAQTDASGNAIDVDERLESDLDAMVFVDIQDKLRQHIPGSIPAS